MAGPERCNYPGSMSNGTRGEGPWFCRHHHLCGDSSEGARIVAESRRWRQGDPIPARDRQTPRIVPKPIEPRDPIQPITAHASMALREPGADESEAA